MLDEAEKTQACSMFYSMLIERLHGEQRYHPEPKAGYHDPFIYQVDIEDVTFHFMIMRYYLDDNRPDLYLWFTPEIKERQENRHTLDIGQEHNITVSCWDWFCTRPDGSTFEEHSKGIPLR